MELRRTETNNIPFSLHDSRIVKIETNSDELIFNLDNVYEYSNDSEEVTGKPPVPILNP